MLLDREDDLAELDRALAEAVTGEGRVLLIEGPAGIGKTVLLGEFRRRARALSMTVLTARGGELERGFGFGVVRQLLDAPLAAARGEERDRVLAGAARLAEPVFAADAGIDEDDRDVTYATLHGLYWLVANLAERAPLVLAVDDAHWADEPSLRFLLHLAHRLAGLPVVIALATRTGTEAHRPDLRSLVLEARAPVLRPRPLSEAAVENLVRASLGAGADAELCRACREATGGNPFLLSELLGELRREARPAREIDPASVRRLAPDRIAAAVLLRVSRLDRRAPSLTRAVAVLGEQARLVTCARLAELDLGPAHALADSLAELAVLERGEPLRFVHPIVRTAIYEDLSAAERAGMHARAARLLAAEHTDPESVAVHLLATEPAGDPDVVRILREAARRASAGGAPDTAAELLRRALAEPPDEHDRPQVLFELGTAEHEFGAPTAHRHLREAGETAADPVLRARAFIGLARDTISDSALQREQLPLYERVANDVLAHDRELALELEAARLGGLLFNSDLPTRFEDQAERFRDLPGQTPAECTLLSFVARSVLANGSAAEAGDVAERAAAHPALATHGGNFWWINTTFCLVAAERYDAAERMLSRALRHAEHIGSRYRFAMVSWLRALSRHRRGDLRGAEADGRANAHNTWHTYGRITGLFSLIDSLTDQGRMDEGEALLAENNLDGDLAPVLPSILLLVARGRLRAAGGDLAAARTDLEQALRWMEASRWLVPGDHDARVALVPVLHGLGEHDRARDLADEALKVATAAQSPRAIGGALRVAGLAHGGRHSLDLLRQAVDTLATSPTMLWRAEALVDLGAALRRDGQRTAARDVLRDGMDLAHRCAAAPLADRAGDELRAVGARPRRPAQSGTDALTASERRVAELAAAGMSNKQIAQALFVTLRTVEMHLSNAYAKLQIRSREGLTRALRN
jgi:DNA-binding CsgD family transcriptional regulator